MEKSMIQDLDAMRTSMGYKNTFTTSFHDGGYELKKSKISNLPSHKKSDLSLPFVVVFQTMEIQRLSEQIEALRIALKDSERQAFNCQSYEIQIRELTDQCHEYDIELLEYKQEIEKLNVISQKLYEELEEWKQKYQNYDPIIQAKYTSKCKQYENLEIQIAKWKDRYRALEKSKDKQMEELKLAMESQRKSVLDREIRELNLKFQAQRGYLNGQIKKMQESQDERQKELTRAKFEAESLRIEKQANLDGTRRLKQAETKLNRLTQELVRLNQILRRKHQEIQRKEANQDYLKDMLKTLERQKLNHQNEATKVPQLESAIKEWIVRFSRLQNENNQNKQQLRRLPTLERDLQNLVAQIQRLGNVIKGKMQQVQDANIKAQKLKAIYEQSKKCQEKIPTLERRITQMGYQAERLNGILKKRLIEVEEGKSRISELQRVLRVFEQAEPQKKRVEQQLKKQIREVQKQKKQIRQLQKQVKRIPQIEAVLADQRNIRQEYIIEVDRLNKLVRDKSEENETCNQKIHHLEAKVSQFSNIESELQAYKSQANRMAQEVDVMNGKIRQKCQLLDELTRTVEVVQESIANFKAVEQKLIENIESNEKLTQDLNETKAQVQRKEQNLLQCQSELVEAKNAIIDINNDREILNRNLHIKNQQLEQAETEIHQYMKQVQELKEIERCYHILREEMMQAQVKMRQLEDLFKKERLKNDQLQYKVQASLNQISRMKTNGYFPEGFRVIFRKLQANICQKQNKLENLLRKQNAMEKCTEEIQQAITGIGQAMKVKNAQWLETNSKIQDCIRHIHTISQLQNQNCDLRTQHLELESQIKILNLEILEAQVRKNANNHTANTITPTSSVTSWSFNTVPSKKAIDSVVEQQTTSRISTISQNKRVLSGSGNILNINNGNAASQSKADESKASSRFLINNPSVSSNAGSQENQNVSTVSINSSRGISPSVLNSYFPLQASRLNSASKDVSQTYFSTKISNTTSSPRQSYAFKSSYRA